MVTVTIAANANGRSLRAGPANAGPAPGIVLAWDGGGSGRHVGTIGDRPTAGHIRQWSGGSVPPYWGPSRYGVWCPYGRLPYWVWGPSGGAFDYPDLLGDWR
jgi:hypothetical protein